jgi:hypothetical protein
VASHPLNEQKIVNENSCTAYIAYRGKHNRSGMVAVLGPVEALPCYIHIHTYIAYRPTFLFFLYGSIALRALATFSVS